MKTLSTTAHIVLIWAEKAKVVIMRKVGGVERVRVGTVIVMTVCAQVCSTGVPKLFKH